MYNFLRTFRHPYLADLGTEVFSSDCSQVGALGALSGVPSGPPDYTCFPEGSTEESKS